MTIQTQKFIKSAFKINLYCLIVFTYSIILVIYVGNDGWHGGDGANISEWVMIIFSYPWIFLYYAIAFLAIILDLHIDIFNEYTYGLIAFVFIPAIMNAGTVFFIKSHLKRTTIITDKSKRN